MTSLQATEISDRFGSDNGSWIIARINCLPNAERKLILESSETLLKKAEEVARELFGMDDFCSADKNVDEEMKEHEKPLNDGIELTADQQAELQAINTEMNHLQESMVKHSE